MQDPSKPGFADLVATLKRLGGDELHDDSQLTPDDLARLNAIVDATDARELAHLGHEYWHDLDRANRTPRSWLYFMLGLLTASIDVLVTERDIRKHRDN